MENGEHETSLEHIHTSELYPRKPLHSDDETLQVPYPELAGEGVEYLSRTEDGVIALSNFRLFIWLRNSFVNVPLRLIESVDTSQMFYMHIYCKDARTFRCKFLTNESCTEWVVRVTRAIQPPLKLHELFAFYFHAWTRDTGQDESSGPSLHVLHSAAVTDSPSATFDQEVRRMGFDLKTAWRISHINESYEVCKTYPKLHIVPKNVSDEELNRAANFRTSHRFPSVVWRDQRNGAVIARCSQPEVGWFSWRSQEDESILQNVIPACSVTARQSPTRSSNTMVTGDGPGEGDDKKMLIIDARSYTAALANRTKGGGVECIEYYPNCEIQFMNLANIHAIRKSFQAMRTLCASSPEQQSWLSGMEATKWLHHISNLMRAALTVVNAIDKEARPVLVHCSDGWDRTPQIVALAELMLDPYYRTFRGFQQLVEREWLDFGHKFGDRCGHGVQSEDVNERCPVFLQWLDCIYQIMKQFPCAFEFGEAFLVKMVQHVYSCLYGTFLCNSSQERTNEKISDQTFSVWTLLNKANPKFINFLYSDNGPQVLRPSFQLKAIVFWSAVYLSDSTQTEEPPPIVPCDESSSDESVEQQPLVKTRSYDDIKAATEHSAGTTRRQSDPNIASDLSEMLKSSLQENAETDKRLDIKNDAVKFYNKPSEVETSNLLPNGNMESPENEAQTDEEADLSNSEVCELTTSSSSVLTNGQSSSITNSETDTETCNTSETQKEHVTDTDSSSVTEPSVESSTDTLMDELAILPSDSKRTSLKHSQLVSTEDTAIGTNLSYLDKWASISTSTSDISDSQVRISGDKLVLPNGNLTLDNALLSLQIPDIPATSRGPMEPLVMNGLFSQGCSHDSIETSSSGTPYNSRTPSSTNPPTPAADNKVSNPWVHRSLHKHLDCDGLTTFKDPGQTKMRHMISLYHRKMEELQKQIHRLALYHYASGYNGAGKFPVDSKDDNNSNAESTGSGEMHSLGAGSNAPSDLSWEQLEGEDARMTLWVPDHAVTHCGGCNQQFGWIANRKHHCRNCGKVFCGECANQFTPVPAQQLSNPVRVCSGCYARLNEGRLVMMNGHASPNNPESCKHRIIAPAAN